MSDQYIFLVIPVNPTRVITNNGIKRIETIDEPIRIDCTEKHGSGLIKWVEHFAPKAENEHVYYLKPDKQELVDAFAYFFHPIFTEPSTTISSPYALIAKLLNEYGELKFTWHRILEDGRLSKPGAIYGGFPAEDNHD